MARSVFGLGAASSGRSAVDEHDTQPLQSVYEQVLGPQIERLHPQLRRYFGPIPAGNEGRGRGVYSWAGPRHSGLRPVFAWLAWRHVLFPERGRSVPFTIRNRPEDDGALSARREFAFPLVTRVMEDTMRAIPVPGGRPRLVDRLGRRRGLEVELELRVHEGGLRMRSTGLWLRMRVPVAVAVLRVPLPCVVTMTLDERAHPDGDGRQCVDVRLRSPIIGDVFRYVGAFAYDVVTVSEP
ncbi:hypothetical protein HDC34_002289 [Pseudoclavibacter sp. JAI123]|uniref:DUF4166 domain-containing protein n=1 Tax=Pseudoclavibacter sp. JAI123 TaxID=2723065 RepID=UPI0015CD0651|nr:DUF4166 domain-containing protein [Pseudoclavibacter sp. JAI123]NYF13995.1 hypothetical protein [Pseudoclavibacter sp. JAI123]